MSYKKRAKNGWNCGKRYKRNSNKSERNYEKEEIFQAKRELVEGDSFRYKTPSKKNLTKDQKLQKKIDSLEKSIEYWERPNVKKQREGMQDSEWYHSYLNSFRDTLKKLKEQLNDKSNK